MEKHITIVAVLSIVFGTLGALFGAFLFVAISGGGLISQDPTAMNVTGIVGTALGGFVMLISVPDIIAGIGLLKRRGWARILAMILAIFDLIQVPIGTAIGIYVFWVLLSDETFKLFSQATEIRKKEQAAGIQPGPKNMVLPIIAITAAVLFLIAISVTILLGAFPWFAIVFGPPLLIFVVFALSQAKGRAATVVAGQNRAAPFKADRRGVFIGLAVAVIALILMATPVLLILLPAIWVATDRHVSTPQEETVEIAPGLQTIGELDFPNGSPDDLTFGPEGPTLNDTCVLKLNLEPQEATLVNSILQAAHKRYQELEARYTEQLRSGNSLKVTISPFREEAKSFLQQFWTDLDSVLDEEQRGLARRHLPLGYLFGKNQFGQARVIFMITKENGTFSHTTTVERPGRSSVGSGKGETLPANLQRFWSQSSTDE
jgi:hypothetical protein